MIGWIKKKLGITQLEKTVAFLMRLEHFTLSDVVDRLSEAYVILADEHQVLEGTHIVVPSGKKGVILLGMSGIVRNCAVRPEVTETTTVVKSLEEA